MKKPETHGLVKRLALPANVPPTEGGSDSRSETLSPREWPTLGAAIDNLVKLREDFDGIEDQEIYLHITDAAISLCNALSKLRSRRPRGESAPMNDRPNY